MHTTNHECDVMSIKPTKIPPNSTNNTMFYDTNIFCALFKVQTQLYHIIS